MVILLSYLFAVVLTVALAIILYPIAAVFWILGLFGKISDKMFKFTKKAIAGLWKDLRETKNPEKVPVDSEWTCSCGTKNKGRFCTNCGAANPATVAPAEDVTITPPPAQE